MRVLLELYGYLSWYAPGQATELELVVPPGTTISGAVALAQLPHGEVAFATVGGVQRGLDELVEEGQHIRLIPPISGG